MEEALVHRQQIIIRLIQEGKKGGKAGSSSKSGQSDGGSPGTQTTNNNQANSGGKKGGKSGAGSKAGANSGVSVENEPVPEQEETPVGADLIQNSVVTPEDSPEKLNAVRRKSGSSSAKCRLEYHA